ncbi:MAG: HEAT repeat domain-containing protein [Gemmatimonadaceae bacterium]|nr:HEAT repeat domain-containing protein [Gemmatimonadaceae bacterium]
MDPNTEALVADLLDPDKNVRIKAALALGELADIEALPALLARLGAEPDFFVRDNLVWAVVRMGHAAVPSVINLLGDDDGTVRYLAAHTLSKFADARALDALTAALDDADPLVAQKATYALGRIRDERSLPALLARLGQGSREARTTLNDALEAFGEALVPALLPLLAGANTPTRVDAVDLLGTIGGPAAADLLSAASADAEWEVRFAAVNALGSVDGLVVRSALELASNDSHPHVRLLAQRLVQRNV